MKENNISRILFICMGNICRSPVVEGVARAEFARAGLAIDVASAGTQSYHIGDPADARAIASARAHGYDVSAHRAQRASPELLARFDAVLAMDRVNLRDLALLCPGARAQLFLPFAGIGDPQEVPDPYYGGTRDFERMIELAQLGVRGLIERIAMPHNVRMHDTGLSA